MKTVTIYPPVGLRSSSIIDGILHGYDDAKTFKQVSDLLQEHGFPRLTLIQKIKIILGIDFEVSAR